MTCLVVKASPALPICISELFWGNGALFGKTNALILIFSCEFLIMLALVQTGGPSRQTFIFLMFSRFWAENFDFL